MSVVVVGKDTVWTPADDPRKDGLLLDVQLGGASHRVSVVCAPRVHRSILVGGRLDTPGLRYLEGMTTLPISDWIAATGPRRVIENPEDTAMPASVLTDPRLSLMAKGLYAVVLAEQGRPINPYEGAFEAVEDIRAAIDELVSAGLVIRTAAR